MREFGTLVVLAVVALAACARPPFADVVDHGGFADGTTVDLADKFDVVFLDELRAAPGQRVRVLVDLSEQLDLHALRYELASEVRTKKARRAAVIAALERVAERQQARVRPAVDRLIADGVLDEVRYVAIVNRLLVEGSGAGVIELAGLGDVARVWREWTSAPSEEAGRGVGLASGHEASFPSWAIRETGAEFLWERGLSGDGVVVATIDTGAFDDHDQLRGRRLPGERGWFDPRTGSTQPYDNDGHGTAVLSLAVGSNVGGHVVGLAPGARWAAALGNWRNYYSRWRMSLAADWVLRVARPDVLINAWSHEEEGCLGFDLPLINAWKAAEIFVVFPAGNFGDGGHTGETPGILTGTFPDGAPVFSVAALMPDGVVHPRSSRGPSPCGSPAFPSLGAPGDALPHAALGSRSSYRTGTGTSLAAAVLGGGAALLLEANPELSPWELERILVETARDLPPPGSDVDSGTGALDLKAALKRVR